MMEEEHLPVCPDQPTEIENQLSSTQETESTEKLVSQDSSVKSVPDEEFVWEEYLEETQTEAVPPTSFQHVEKSLESGVLEDHLVEVVHSSSGQQPTGYWLAKVVTTCGPLLRLRYVAPSSVNVECWREVAHGGLHPVGWCGHHNIQLSLPSDLMSELVDEDSIKEAKEAVEQAQREGISVPEEALDVEGYTAVDRVKHGMKVEVLFDGNPLCGWVATVMDNVGGRLLLRYDTPDCSGETFWLFYQHPRLRPPDWIHHQGHLWNYSHPTSSTPYEYAEWAALLELSRDDARHSSLPVSLLAPTLGPDTHQFIAGMLLEVVHPFKPYSVHVGKVLEIIDSHFFRIAVDSETSEEISWVTYVNDPLILPWGFCKENNLSIEPPKDWPSETVFDWDTYLRSSTSLCAESEIFKKFESSEDICFSPGLKLEAVNPSAPNQICAATVNKTCGHLLVIQLDSDPDSKPIIRASTSQDIFPTGWCQANNYPLKLPAQYSPLARSLENTSMEASQERNSDNSQTTEAVSSGGGSQKSLWCPRLYVNHWCYTGPYLSKSKVAKQSQSVGPGSVELVLREVLSMTINAAYIPTRVLRELERRNGPDPQLVSSSWHSIPFKAKFKRYTYTANIPVATTASDISDFLYSICQTLQCCPNLWSSNLTGENCPLLCTSQMSIQGSQTCLRGRGRISINKGVRGGPGTSRIIHRRKRGGRKRLFVPVRANRLLQTKTLTTPSDDISEDVEEEEDAEIEEGEDDDVGSGSDEGDTSSRSSRPTSPFLEHGVGSRRRRRAFPRLEMQTRGVKLPDYATQMKMRHVKKKYEGEASSSASSCREEPLDRKDQMRRDRKNEYPDTNSGLEPATVTSDPLEWTVHDVEQYVASQPAICHHAVRLREQEVDGRAFLLLNLPTLVHHLGLPHSSAVALAQHICRVKLAHFLYYYRAEA
ncbi:scm-like with four MBT domains protein 1 [Homarus americanus]|uniref:Scm-like with four MBT domains protein 2-like n=1 Tax=Homarus americanus TaxID=6706 RepID=A0A8J5NB60_HOMAM|nr:scm-like with four MBT domains protein 1 [Homarus americanus]KAG7176228.1 Scm-like with four MBT domains protein 2-like [Homarus americanus]